MTKIGDQDGIHASVERLRKLDPGGTKPNRNPDDLSTWGAWDKLERTLQILADDHDTEDDEYRPPVNADLDTVKARIFLANDPLECLKAPTWMVPVCTADQAYRYWYTSDTLFQLYERFGTVEAWCDCRNPTAYETAVQMVAELDLDGPAWGQCETTAEFDHAYENGCRRMVGSINAQVLDDTRLAKISSGEVLVTVELYRNLQPNMQPDWRGANNGIGGNTIACYASSTEGAVYTPVASYRAAGLYVPKQDSVYGVGLSEQDWHDLD